MFCPRAAGSKAAERRSNGSWHWWRWLHSATDEEVVHDVDDTILLVIEVEDPKRPAVSGTQLCVRQRRGEAVPLVAHIYPGVVESDHKRWHVHARQERRQIG